MPATELGCFKAYDIRGRLGPELNEEIAYRFGASFAKPVCTVRQNAPCVRIRGRKMQQRAQPICPP
ncbi:hypothetical protein DQW77_16080 [Roseovarius sp. TE539]|nr:hypothetical protein DQW77_16080 [Roseovarius sp. TE539]